MATSKTYPFPIILTRNLPLSNASLKENDSILVIRNNTTTERMSGDVLPDTSKTYITLTNDAPSEFSSVGSPGAIAWDKTGVYTYTDGTWGKSVRVRTHWEDYTETTRFVLVNTLQNLSEDEQKIGRSNLGIDSATTKTEGLVRLAVTANDDDDDAVITAGVLTEYMNNFSVPYATASIPGIIKLANEIKLGDEGVPTASQVIAYVNASISGVGKASTTTYGTVRMAAAMSITETGVVTAAQVVNYFNHVWNTLPQATTSAYGTVILATDINENNTGVPTAQQVAAYVKEQQSSTELTIPDATTEVAGKVRLAETVSETETGVVTGKQVADYVKEELKTAAPTIADATTEVAGKVKLAEAMTETDEGVVSAKQVVNYVKEQSINLGSYQGSVSITGPDGVELFVYDPATKELRLGMGVTTLKIKAQNVTYIDEQDEVHTEISQD